MITDQKTVKVVCFNCKKRFYASFKLEQPGAKGTGLVPMSCIYCKQIAMAKVPISHINEKLFQKNLRQIREKYNIKVNDYPIDERLA